MIDATPITIKSSGVGLYVSNLIQNLYPQLTKEVALGLVYQPGFKAWLRNQSKFPDYLTVSKSDYLLPFPVRVSNLFLDYYPKFFSSYVEPKLGNVDIFHGTNYTVFPFQKCRKVMTIYDVTFLKYPEYVNSVVKQYG
ncbi:MAG: glycosyltransferase family 1 protein, partial [Bacteroidota bacterium]